MKILIAHVRQAGEAVETTTVDLEHESGTQLATVALAALAGVRFNSSEIRSLLDYDKLDLAAAAEVTPIRRRFLNFDAIAERARDTRQLELELTGDVTGENILALMERRGGTATYTHGPDGVIDQIAASFGSDYDYSEASEVLESLQATGQPHTAVGDLAQTSILTANGQEQVLALAEWSISWKRKTVESTTTDNAAYESSMGSTASWTAKAKYMMLIGDASQTDAIMITVDTVQKTATTWNFFPTVAAGDPAFQGDAWVDGIDVSAGTGKVVGLDVSLKGTGVLKRLTQGAPVANANTVTGTSAQV